MPDTESLPSKPISVISSLSSGLDTVIQGWWILLFPIALDLFLWFGDRLSIKPVADRVINDLIQIVGETAAFDLVLQAASKVNYFSLISVAPLGVPNLMSLKLPDKTPLGQPGVLTINSETAWIAMFGGLLLAGIFLGGIYLGLIAQQVRDGSVNLLRLFSILPRYWVSILALVITILMISGIMALPMLLIATFVASLSSWLATLVVWAGMILLLWLFFHLFFSIHGILLSEEGLMTAVWNSLRLTALNSFPTLGLLITALAISVGLNYLWSLPKEDSWMLMVGILGHAFISSGLIAATFVFYQDRYRYWRELRSYLLKTSEKS